MWLFLVFPMISEETADETSAQSENLPDYCGAGCCAAWLLRCRGESDITYSILGMGSRARRARNVASAAKRVGKRVGK